ncbi:MAG: hypothetical protein IPG04_40065 [Polyangiaceae bacterium]|nr:hypothetical protein [Polyangiaceae bacterium]
MPKSLDDLPPQTRRLLDLVTELVHERMARDGGAAERGALHATRAARVDVLGPDALRLHLERLEGTST